MKKYWILSGTLFMAAIMFSCGTKDKQKETETVATTGTIERLDPAFDNLITGEATVEIIGEGFDWSEGPVWVASANKLLFTDVPQNKIYQWDDTNETSVYLEPSGYTGSEPTKSTEPGANGLIVSPEGKLILCQHGDRRIAVMDAPLDAPTSTFTSVADNYQGKKLNSPNDLVMSPSGDIYFTDPPYGLPGRGAMDDPQRELMFQGVYKVSTSGEITLLTDSLTRPNGIAVTPDQQSLIVANSDPEKAIWYIFDITENGLNNARVFYDASEQAKTEKGLPDGFKIDAQGNVFASGPGGVWVFDKTGKVLGKIKLEDATSNIALADGDKTLYVTNDGYLLRVKMR